MDQSLTISIEDLRSACALVLDELERVHGAQLPAAFDYFWAIPKDKMSDPYREPVHHTMGQVSASVDDLLRLVLGHRAVTAFDAVKLGEVLQSVGSSEYPTGNQANG